MQKLIAQAALFVRTCYFGSMQSDPIAVVYMKKRNGTLEEIGRTEVILNDLNPVWIGKISVAYHFETVQSLV